MNLLEFYNSIDLDKINNFIDEGKEENLQLEFKLINRANLTHGDDKKNLAKALSGFANSSGGLIIWGIKAAKNKDGIDCSQEKSIILDLPLFISKLNEFTGIAVNPIVDGVLHKPINVGDKDGFAVTYIPESDSGPHMAKFSEDRYYKRSGDSFYKMEHFDLEDMFGRRKKPSLVIFIEVLNVYSSMSEKGAPIIIHLLNNGRGSAKAPYLEITTPAKCKWSEYGYDGNGNTGLPKIHYYPTSKIVKFGSDAHTVIHPGVSISISKLIFNYNKNDIKEGFTEIMITYKTAAEDMRLQEKNFYIKGDDLNALLKIFV